MRDVFCRTLVGLAPNPKFVFLTGDLGFKALEPLRDALGPRFLNAGVAEQNMVSMAAGLARQGFRPWIYSIAPFLYARPFEQIRNDVCLHNLPVVMVGNGGGYGYGVMGSTHHALEDYGCLLTLSGLHAYMPAFDHDVESIGSILMETPHPSYLRLGLSELPADTRPAPYAPWRKLLDGAGPTLAICGPLAGGILAAASNLPPAARPEIWLVAELPLAPPPPGFLDSLRRTNHLCAVEEHTAAGGFGQTLAYHLARLGRCPARFTHRHAQGYVSGLYGSQKFHRRESALDPASILEALQA